MLPDKVSVTATMSVIRTGPQHMSAVASLKEVTCFVEAEQKLIGFPTLQGGAGGGGGTVYWGDIYGRIANQADLASALSAKANTADLGALASKNTADYATDVTNKPTLGTMASVNDASSDDKIYGRKNGTWVEVTGGGGGSVDWGDIGGTLSNQDDLQNALDAKADKLDLAEEFDATKNYYEDACVIYNNVLYVFNEYKAAGVWDSTKVTQLAAMPIVDRKLAWKANVSEIAPAFETSQSYSAGDYVSYDGHLFQFVADKAAGAWDWNKAIPRSVYYVMNQRLSAKQDTLTFDTTPTASSTNPVTSDGIKTALDTKQGTLTFDTAPTANSANPVTSGGIKTALDAKADLASEILYFSSQTVSVATNAQIMRIPASGTNSNITTNTVVLECTFAKPSYITTEVSWQSYSGYVTFTGTCKTATTANVTLGRKGN